MVSMCSEKAIYAPPFELWSVTSIQKFEQTAFVRTKSRSHLTAIVATGGDPYFTAFVGTDDGGRHLTAIAETGGGLHLDQHRGHQGVGLLFAHQNLHNLQGKLKARARAPTCDQLSILNNAIFRVCVAS